MTQESKVSTRGLIEADLGILRRFTGILDSAPTETSVYQPRNIVPSADAPQGKPTTRVSLNFREIDPIEAVEPYHFPIYTIVVSKSNRKKSRWGVFSEGTPSDRSLGFNNIVDQQYSPEQLDPGSPEYIKPLDRMDLEDCFEKRFGMVLTDGIDGRPQPMDLFDGRANEGRGGDTPTPAWTVYEVEGIGVAGGQGTSGTDLAMKLLDNSTLADFNAAALANPAIRADTALLQSIALPPTAKNSFANTVVSADIFTKDSAGVFHKV